MVNILPAAEIVEIGIEKEKKRRDFYALVADQYKDNKELSELFVKLRDWEEEHIRRFQEIRDTVSKAQYTETYPGETEAYMQALVDSDLYDKITPEGFSSMVSSPEEALDMGIRFEKDAILFFNGLSRFADDAVKKVTAKLIEEEQQHMLYLYDMKKKMKGEC
jgi:rubrerythrin